MSKYYLAFAIAQILLKIGATRNCEKHILKLFLNTWTIIGYALIFIVVVLNTYALTKLPLITGIIFNPFVYIIVALLSITILKEKMSRNQLIGSAIIILGVVIFTLGNIYV
jgi:drug/metabolite transporter (DMT)-like permease